MAGYEELSPQERRAIGAAIALYLRWLRKEAVNAIKADLLDAPYPGPIESDAPSDDLEWLTDAAPSPEELVLQQELEQARRTLPKLD